LVAIAGGLGLGLIAGRIFTGGGRMPENRAKPSPAIEARSRLQAPGIERPAPASAATGAGKRALLVGVTKYDNVPDAQLDGPANDVRLVRRFLTERYQFPAERIVALTENEGAPALRPTRANIEREFHRLADNTRAGDQVVILMAGHGSRQPERDPPDPNHSEVDGLDEIFLPADVRPWAGMEERVPNAIVDDEMGAWLRAITAKSAYVWAIFDCCHSGTMTRGTEVVRELPPETLVPRAELAKARERAAIRPGSTRADSGLKPPSFLPAEPSDYLVATFACRSNETTPEGLQPPGSPDAEPHGLLTYSLIDVLTKSADSNASLTYRELVRRLQARYAGRIQGAPTPLVEGSGQDRVVLGTERPSPSPFVLTRERGQYKVNAGDLYGLTPGSILAVETPASVDGKRTRLGHVRVRTTSPFAATVEPCAFDGAAREAYLPPLASCRLVFLDYGSRRIKLAIQAPADQRASTQRVRAGLEPLADPAGGLIELVDDARRAEWIVRFEPGKLALLEASGNRTPFDLLHPDNFDLAGSLRAKLEKIYRARTLMAIASRFEGERNRAGSEIDLEIGVLVHKDAQDPGVELCKEAGERVFRPGDLISFRVRNTSRTTNVNVTLLVVASDLGIAPFYPQESNDDRVVALEPGKTLDTPRPWGSISRDPPFGPECLVAIAAPAARPPVDFTILTQGGASLTRSGGASESLRTPLGELLTSAMFRTRSSDGLSPSVAARYGMRILTWRTEPR
jgi:hypothetical protein